MGRKHLNLLGLKGQAVPHAAAPRDSILAAGAAAKTFAWKIARPPPRGEEDEHPPDALHVTLEASLVRFHMHENPKDSNSSLLNARK